MNLRKYIDLVVNVQRPIRLAKIMHYCIAIACEIHKNIF